MMSRSKESICIVSVGILLFILIYIFFVRNRFFNSLQNHKNDCNPLHPTSSKLKSLDCYKDGKCNLFFWHIQKAGGSSICETMSQELTLRNKKQYNNNSTIIDYKGDNCNGPWLQILEESYKIKEISKKFKPDISGKMISIEPAYNYLEHFPSSYHSNPFTKKMLNEKPNLSGLGDDSIDGGPFWSLYPHFIAIRHPFESSLSAFTYDFAGSRQSILGSCLKRKLSIEMCMKYAIDVKENLNNHTDVWGSFQRTKIRTHLLGNFLLSHLSTHSGSSSRSNDNDNNINYYLTQAKLNLKRMSLIVDLSFETISLDLMQRVLGWHHVATVPKLNAGSSKKGRRAKEISGGAHGIKKQLSKEMIETIRSYMKTDEDLYNYGLSLMMEHYNKLFYNSKHGSSVYNDGNYGSVSSDVIKKRIDYYKYGMDKIQNEGMVNIKEVKKKKKKKKTDEIEEALAHIYDVDVSDVGNEDEVEFDLDSVWDKKKKKMKEERWKGASTLGEDKGKNENGIFGEIESDQVLDKKNILKKDRDRDRDRVRVSERGRGHKKTKKTMKGVDALFHVTDATERDKRSGVGLGLGLYSDIGGVADTDEIADRDMVRSGDAPIDYDPQHHDSINPNPNPDPIPISDTYPSSIDADALQSGLMLGLDEGLDRKKWKKLRRERERERGRDVYSGRAIKKQREQIRETDISSSSSRSGRGSSSSRSRSSGDIGGARSYYIDARSSSGNRGSSRSSSRSSSFGEGISATKEQR